MTTADNWRLQNFLRMYTEDVEIIPNYEADPEFRLIMRADCLTRIAEKMTELNARHLLHLRNPALREAWDKYITMENLANDLTRDDLEY